MRPGNTSYLVIVQLPVFRSAVISSDLSCSQFVQFIYLNNLSILYMDLERIVPYIAMTDIILEIGLSSEPKSLLLIDLPFELILELPFVISSAHTRSEMLKPSTFLEI